MDDAAGLELKLEGAPDPGELRRLEELLYAFNVEATGIDDGEGFAFFLRAPDGAVAGGAAGWTWGGTCCVSHLLVPAALRRKGVGTRLMRRVEAMARARGCGRIVLDTHDFQAPDFYRRLGYGRVGAVEGYLPGHRRETFLKRLD